MKQFRLKVNVRNNRLIRYREELGLSAPKLAKAAGVSYGLYIRYESMKRSPLLEGTQADSLWRDSARRIADFHGVDPEELWPQAVLEFKEVEAERKVSFQQLAVMSGATAQELAPSPEEEYERVVQENSVEQVLQTLDPREREILIHRFGLRGFDEAGLREIGELFGGLSTERIRQIESKALRSIRHPKRMHFIKGQLPPANTRLIVHQLPHQLWLSCGHVRRLSSPWVGKPRVRCFACFPLTKKERQKAYRPVVEAEAVMERAQKHLQDVKDCYGVSPAWTRLESALWQAEVHHARELHLYRQFLEDSKG